MLSLLIAHLPLPAVPHDGLHPADTALYFELPAIPTAVEALGDAPMARLFRDEELREATSIWIESDQLSAENVVQDALSLTPLPPPVVELVASIVYGLETASVSLSGLPTDPDRHVAEAHQVAEALRELQTIRRFVASLPSPVDGSELYELGGELLTDPWGNDYIFEPAIDDGEHTLLSLGRDGAHGGVGIDADLDLSLEAEARIVDRAFAGLGLQLVLDFERDDLAASAYQLLDQALSQSKLESSRGTGYTLGDRSGGATSTYQFDELQSARFSLAYSGDLLVLVAGANDLDDVSDRAARKAPNLADSERYQSTMAPVLEGPGVTVFNSFSDASAPRIFAVIDAFSAVVPEVEFFWPDIPGMAEADLQSMRMVVHGGRIKTTAFTPLTDHARDLLWVGTKPVSRDLANLVPEDAMAVFLTSLDGPTLGQVFMDWYATETGVDVEAWQAAIEEEHGFHLSRDLFGSLGDDMLAFMLPIRGIGAPKMSVWVELADPDAAERAIERLASVIVESLPAHLGEFSLKPRQYKGYDLLTLQLPADELGPAAAFVDPCAVVVDDHLLITLNSLQAKREIKRLLKLREDPETVPSDAHPLFARERPELEGAYTIILMDWGALIEGVDATFRGIGSMMLAGAGDLDNGFDIDAIPPAELITDYIEPTLHVQRAVPGGLWMEHTSSFGPETWIGLPVFAAAIAGRVQRIHEGGSDSPESVSAPEPKPDANAFATDQTVASLRKLRVGLQVYFSENGAYPTDLADLISPTTNWPNGFLNGGAIPADGWNRAFVYAQGPSAGAYSLHSIGPNGVDESGGGDDVALD